MASSGLLSSEFMEFMSQLARRAVAGVNEARLQPIIDQQNGLPDGVLVESPLERVVVCGREQTTLSMTDISTVRRTMTRVQAHRAVLYVPVDMTIPSPVMLLASLSKIQIMRMAPASPTPS